MRRLDDRDEIASRLAADKALHVYEIGDLDDFFFPSCTYFAADTGETALLYRGNDPPTLVLLSRREASEDLERFLLELAPSLPATTYGHLAVGLAGRVASSFTFEPQGLHQKMALGPPPFPTAHAEADGCLVLGPDDLETVLAFYRRAYPHTWFTPRMLETGAYRGWTDGGELVAIAGVHVVSRARRVAALGNIATDPRHRGLGLARRVSAAVLRSLESDVDVVGLNVLADNAPAIACYRRLGFTDVAPYEEVVLHKR